MVGRGGLEPPTLRLSGVRSNHLSYRPIAGRPPDDRAGLRLLNMLKGYEDGPAVICGILISDACQVDPRDLQAGLPGSSLERR